MGQEQCDAGTMLTNKTMLGYAALVLLIGLAAFFVGRDSAVLFQSSNIAERNSEQRKIIADSIIEDDCNRLTGELQVACITDAVKESLEYRISEVDLNAQQRMAKYAGWALLLTVFGTGVASISVLYLAKTVRTTEEVNKDSQRAYVQADKAEFRWGSKNGSNPVVTLHASNTGNTPAIHFSVRSICVILGENDRELDLEKLRAELESCPQSTWNAFAANEKQSFRGITRAEDRLALIQEYTKRRERAFVDDAIPVRIFGDIRYETFFGEHISSEFIFEGLIVPTFNKVSERTIEERDVQGIKSTYKEYDEKPQHLPKRSAKGLLTYSRI